MVVAAAPQAALHPPSADADFERAKEQLIATGGATVLPHLDDGGHIPFGGMIDGTRGPSAFGKRKVTADTSGHANPMALMLNYPPPPTEMALKYWDRNYKSSIAIAMGDEDNYESSSRDFFGKPKEESYLAAHNYTHGDLRMNSFTRPQGVPFFPTERGEDAPEPEQIGWEWPQREVRKAQPRLKRPVKLERSFLEEYEARPPWLKY
mgnify:FL=1